MRILYVAQKHDYGKPERGLSFEHWNFSDTLGRIGHELLYFDLGRLLDPGKRAALNQRLLEIVRSEKPDLMFTVLYENELDKNIVRRISFETDTTTFNWFADDHWRFESFSRHWAPCFNWVSTTAGSALPKYGRLGYRNVIKTQWGCNHYLYRKLDVPLKYDVSFVGQPHGNRRAVIEALRGAGLNVATFGGGWDGGRISQEQMIEVFNSSRINLNLSNASMVPPTPARRVASAFLRHVPGAMAAWRRIRKRTPKGAGANASLPVASPSDQIKGRNFEVPGCGGFLLTGLADNLTSYFEPGCEIACFGTLDELLATARRYLHDDEQRTRVAGAGYERTLSQHTYVHRFTEIFEHIGLRCEPSSAVMNRAGKTPTVQEI
ncbi:MAG TPA: glycosyltransferase [Tepidisphaeraceae bacterium]|jgi:spore maturation protein CgeB|nr:glycosyltransferase [Tepidisphaeraceae bacterium]